MLQELSLVFTQNMLYLGRWRSKYRTVSIWKLANHSCSRGNLIDVNELGKSGAIIKR